jgi:DnaJ-class molecular chaperone
MPRKHTVNRTTAQNASTEVCWRCEGEGSVHLFGATYRICRMCKGGGVVYSKNPSYNREIKRALKVRPICET